MDTPDVTDPAHRSLVREFLFHEAERTHTRTDWFLIFHAILFEAYFTADKSQVVALAGLVTSCLWFATGMRQSWIMMHLGKCMADQDLMGSDLSHVFGAVFAARRAGLSKGRWVWRAFAWARPVPVFCVVTPLIFISAWAAILWKPSQHAWSGWKLAAIGVGALFASVAVALWHGPGPNIDQDLVNMVRPAANSSE